MNYLNYKIDPRKEKEKTLRLFNAAMNFQPKREKNIIYIFEQKPKENEIKL
jgi:hypothetical protein